MRRTSTLLAMRTCLCLAASIMFASVAHAGPVEQLAQVALHPLDPNIQVARYVNGRGGLFYSADGGRSWKLLCSSIIARTITPTALTIGHDGRTLIGTTSGLWQDDGTGCGWTREPSLEGRYVSDLVVHPDDPQALYAVTANAAAGSLNGIVRRNADGTWSDVGAQTPLSITRLRIVRTPEGLRFYESAQMGAEAFIRVSNDEGQSWEEHRLADVDTTSTLVRLQAVDPTQPDRVLVSVEDPNGEDSVLVSTDQGVSFTEYLKLTELSAVLLASDGRVWVSDSGGTKNDSTTEGIWHAANLDVAPQRILDQQTRCLSRRPDEDTLYACLRWKFGPVDVEDQCVASLLEVYAVDEMVECPGVDATAVCEAQLCADYCRFDHFPKTPLCAVYDTDECGPNAAVDGVSIGGSDACKDSETPDAGTPTADAGPERDAGREEPEGTEPTKKSSDGCTLSSSKHPAFYGLGWFAALAMALVARSRKRL